MLTRSIAPLLIRFGRAELVQALISATYLLLGGALAWLGLHAGSGALLPAAAVIGGGAAFAWKLSNHRWHVIHDTPTTRVRSAAQGYVELEGIAALLPGQHPPAMNGLPPCVWCEVSIADSSGLQTARWTRTSDETFLLSDPTGDCVIDPDHAEVHDAHVKRWKTGERRYVARYLRQGEPLYAIGSLETLRGVDGGFDRRADVADLLRQWKRDPEALSRRFDADGDGEVSAEEWDVAVSEAERIVDAQHRERRDHPDIHIMRAPSDGQPYILSNRDPESVARRFRYWSWFHAAAFFLAVAGGAWVLVP